MTNPSSPDSPVGSSTPVDRPHRPGGITALLVLLTLLGVLSLVVAFNLMVDASSHNRGGVGLLSFGVLLAVVGLIALGGAWASKYWGPWVYLVAVVIDRVVAFVAVPEAFTPLLLVGVVLAIPLVAYAERNWAPARKP